MGTNKISNSPENRVTEIDNGFNYIILVIDRLLNIHSSNHRHD